MLPRVGLLAMRIIAESFLVAGLACYALRDLARSLLAR